MPGSSPPARRSGPRDRVLAVLSRLLSRGFFRSVESTGPRPPAGPVILAASHLNGFVDPVLMVADLGALPRFLAKATLWDVVVARPFLRLAHLIPVHRRVDAGGDGAVDNRDTFAAAVGALADGHLLAVFPEGTTHDDPSIRPLRTGVARIALQAAAEGHAGVRIVPVGISYEDKVAVRGRALIHYGAPLEVEPPPEGAAVDDHDAVRALTARLDEALRDVTPDFASIEDEVALTTAARVTLRTDAGDAPVPVARTMALAARLAERSRTEVEHLTSAVARYLMLLSMVHVRDEDLVPGTTVGRLARRLVGLAVLIVVLAPFAATGMVVNAVPATVVLAAGLVPKAPVSKGTVRLLVGTLVFPLTWAFVALRDSGGSTAADVTRGASLPAQGVVDALFSGSGGWGPDLIVFLAMPLFGAAALLLIDRVRVLIRDAFVWRTLVDRRGQLHLVRERRAELVAETRGLAAAAPSPTASTPGAPTPPGSEGTATDGT